MPCNDFRGAISQGKLTVVLTLLRNGIDPDELIESGRTALQLAAEVGALEVARALVEGGADLEARSTLEGDSDHHTPLLLASRAGPSELVRYLLSRGANVEAITTGGLAYGYTALQLAALYCHIDVVRALVEHGADINRAEDSIMCATPLLAALAGGSGEVIQYLAGRGASIEAHATKAVLSSASGGGIDAFLWVLANCCNPPIHTTDDFGCTALHYAAMRGSTEITELLIARGVDVNAANSEGWIPLHYACQGGHLYTAQELLRAGANVDASDLSSGQTPLHVATGRGHLPIVRLLIEHGADASAKLRGPFWEGDTALDVAKREEQAEVVSFLAHLQGSATG